MGHLRSAGIKRLSLDLIYGLPGETLDEVEMDVEALLSLDPGHFSAYSLEIKDGTPLERKGLHERPDAVLKEHSSLIKEKARERGYLHYEVSSFARPGEESRHNLVYWHDEPYVGLGMGAAGFEDGIRYVNPSTLVAYLSKAPRTEEHPSLEEEREYFLLTNLRLAAGFRLAEAARRFGDSFVESLLGKARPFLHNGLLLLEEGSLRPSEEGLDLLDYVLRGLFA